MPVRSDMREIRRYGSTNSLQMSRDLRLSTASGESAYSDDKHDSMYVSSPDLSQGSHTHTRSSSTDSMDGNYYGNHSRQSSGGTDNHSTRRTSSNNMRKISTSIPDPMQFVKLKSAADLAAQAKKQMEVTKEVNIMRGKVDSPSSGGGGGGAGGGAGGGDIDEQDWQSNFSSWKSRRKSTHTRIDGDSLDEDMEKKPQKTFGQIVAEKEKRTMVEPRPLYGVEITEEKTDKQDDRHKRRSLGAMNFYPVDDDDGIGVKSRESLLSKSSAQKNESKPKAKKTPISPWARDSSGEENSQSDSETNNSHQSGDTDSVFSDKSTPSKILSDDDSWMKGQTNTSNVQSNPTPPVRTQRSLGDGRKLWESSANESQRRNDKRIKDLPTNSANIRNITKAFEQKDKDANAAPVVAKRSEFNRSLFSKSLDLTDHSYTKPYSTTEKKPPSPLSPTSPKALVPRDQRYISPARSTTSYIPAGSPTSNNVDQKFTEKTIKINQKPNNDRGFGFYLVGGVEKRQPVTVHKVSLGSAADVCEVEANDEIISVNSRDVATLTCAQVQGIVDHSVKRGQIELRIKRYVQEDGYDSMEDEDNEFIDKQCVSNNFSSSMDAQANSSQSTDRSDDTGNYRPTLQMSMKTDDRPRLMDQLIGEQQREENNNEKKKNAPETVETFSAAVKINTQSTPRQQTTPVKQTSVSNQDMSAPEDLMLTEERPTISVNRSTVSAAPQADHSPVQMRRARVPAQQNYPPDPTQPKAELPSVTKYTNNAGVASTDDSSGSGFGPPNALRRWQRPRPKSEYAGSNLSERTKRYSVTLPHKSDLSFTFDKDYSKDDSMIDTKDFIESVSVSKPVESKPNAYQFNDTSRIEDWQQKQDQHRLPEQHSSTPPMHREQNLTAQSAAPARKHAQIDAPNLTQINKPDFNESQSLSPQEKFEREQQRIRLQYEEERTLAREADKRKQEQEQQALNSDKFLRDMESQILQTKQEATNHNIDDTEPIRSVGTQPMFSSEPMTIQLASNTPARQLIIDPRNRGETIEILPQYSFQVNLSKNESGPPLRILEQHGSPEELLAREREKIREEEKHKFEEEQQRWREEKEGELRKQQESIEREREHLQREQERIARERAMLEQKARHEDNFTSRYLPVNNNNMMYASPRSSTGSAGSSLSPRSPPHALQPKHHLQSRTAPPPTAPKPERGPTKGRLTREDLLAMNRKATPLVRPDTVESGDSLDNGLSPTPREAPSKGELHSLNAVPKQKFRSSAAWIKDEETDNNTQTERPFVIGNRSDIIHQRDYSNPSDHWVVREAEKRRLAEQADYVNSESMTAHAGPIKPSASSLVSRFRGDIEPPPRSNRFSYPSSHSSDIRLSPTPRSGSGLHQYDRSPEQTQFSARTQPNTLASSSALSQTLPPNFSFNANVRNLDGVQSMMPARSLADDTGPVIAVSGKQKCSHCGEELGFGAAMVIESLGLYYHVQCFRCCVCHAALGNGSEGTDVRVRVNKLHCRNCYSNDEAGLKFSKV